MRHDATKRYTTVTGRLSRAEQALVRALAAQQRTSVSKLVRAAVLQQVRDCLAVNAAAEQSHAG